MKEPLRKGVGWFVLVGGGMLEGGVGHDRKCPYNSTLIH